MLKDTFFKVMLVIIAVLLFFNLLNHISPSKAIGTRYSPGAIACSASGQYVYLLSGDLFQYSKDYGDSFHPKPIMTP